ncbi:MAG TPA: hypothetical protein VEJ23_05605 [Solirubrobacteraceae bacterium]|nr:hypothetical protein [Solirubrobacteraceae bacterium]
MGVFEKYQDELREPVCDGCGRPAPAPSEDIEGWILQESWQLVFCPDCAGSEPEQRAVLDAKRRAMFDPFEPGSSGVFDMIAWPEGRAKTVGDLTEGDLEWLAEDVRQHAARAQAWHAWFQARGVFLGQGGG